MDGTINEFYKKTIMDMSERVLISLARRYENIQKGVGSVMVGQVFDTEARRIWNRAYAEGYALGYAEGYAQGFAKAFKMVCIERNDDTLISLVEKGMLTAENAGKVMGITADEFIKRMKEV